MKDGQHKKRESLGSREQRDQDHFLSKRPASRLDELSNGMYRLPHRKQRARYRWCVDDVDVG